MCGSKVFKKVFGGDDDYTAPPPPAASVAAPTDDVKTNVSSEREQRRNRAKGKKRLTISTPNLGGGVGGTGVNI